MESIVWLLALLSSQVVERPSIIGNGACDTSLALEGDHSLTGDIQETDTTMQDTRVKVTCKSAKYFNVPVEEPDYVQLQEDLALVMRDISPQISTQRHNGRTSFHLQPERVGAGLPRNLFRCHSTYVVCCVAKETGGSEERLLRFSKGPLELAGIKRERRERAAQRRPHKCLLDEDTDSVSSAAWLARKRREAAKRPKVNISQMPNELAEAFTRSTAKQRDLIAVMWEHLGNPAAVDDTAALWWNGIMPGLIETNPGPPKHTANKGKANHTGNKQGKPGGNKRGGKRGKKRGKGADPVTQQIAVDVQTLQGEQDALRDVRADLEEVKAEILETQRGNVPVSLSEEDIEPEVPTLQGVVDERVIHRAADKAPVRGFVPDLFNFCRSILSSTAASVRWVAEEAFPPPEEMLTGTEQQLLLFNAVDSSDLFAAPCEQETSPLESSWDDIDLDQPQHQNDDTDAHRFTVPVEEDCGSVIETEERTPEPSPVDTDSGLLDDDNTTEPSAPPDEVEDKDATNPLAEIAADTTDLGDALTVETPTPHAELTQSKLVLVDLVTGTLSGEACYNCLMRFLMSLRYRVACLDQTLLFRQSYCKEYYVWKEVNSCCNVHFAIGDKPITANEAYRLAFEVQDGKAYNGLRGYFPFLCPKLIHPSRLLIEILLNLTSDYQAPMYSEFQQILLDGKKKNDREKVFSYLNVVQSDRSTPLQKLLFLFRVLRNMSHAASKIQAKSNLIMYRRYFPLTTDEWTLAYMLIEETAKTSSA